MAADLKCTRARPAPLTFRKAVFLGILAVASFHLAYSTRHLSALMLLFVYGVASLARLPTGRAAFYAGLLVGLAIYSPQLGFFWTIFGPPAVALWAVLAFWIGLFVLLAHRTRHQFGPAAAAVAIPFLWMGIEYFRSELYYLRFGWLSPGFAFSGYPEAPIFAAAGVYGIGFGLAALASLLAFFSQRTAISVGISTMLGIGLLGHWPAPNSRNSDLGTNVVVVAGVQIEFPMDLEVPGLLDKVLRECPSAQLLMLSECTFDGPVPKRVRDWCKKNRRYLVVGGKDVLSASDYYNTAFVIGPTGEVVFQQAKSVPIQFFKDGFPAKERHTWDSPWGRLGICICYDLSYSRVTDDLVRQGAQALLVPTMDVVDWGEHQHRLHARVAPMRAAEYRIPIFRVASSGISQLATSSGKTTAWAPFGKQGTIVSGQLRLGPSGGLPWDRHLAPLSTVFTGLLACWLVAISIVTRHANSHGNPAAN